jgi:NAD(P)H-flavin reductase
VASIGPGSGQQNLLALLRAIRLKSAGPDAAAQPPAPVPAGPPAAALPPAPTSGTTPLAPPPLTPPTPLTPPMPVVPGPMPMPAPAPDAAAYRPLVWTAVVVEHDRRRSDLAVLRLRPSLPMPFRAGQYARIEVPELPGVWRPYSLAGAPRTDNVLELHVRAKGESGVSGALVHRIGVGDQVRLSRAEGRMGLPEATQRDLLLIGGDTGVAPLKAVLTELAATGDPRSAVLFWGARTLDELYDIEEITAIARACRRATVVPVISEGDPGPYASGLVTDAVAAYGEWSRHEVFLAGPPPMLVATGAVLAELGIEADRIHHDAPEP